MPAGSERATPRNWDQPAILSGLSVRIRILRALLCRPCTTLGLVTSEKQFADARVPCRPAPKYNVFVSGAVSKWATAMPKEHRSRRNSMRA